MVGGTKSGRRETGWKKWGDLGWEGTGRRGTEEMLWNAGFGGGGGLSVKMTLVRGVTVGLAEIVGYTNRGGRERE